MQNERKNLMDDKKWLDNLKIIACPICGTQNLNITAHCSHCGFALSKMNSQSQAPSDNLRPVLEHEKQTQKEENALWKYLRSIKVGIWLIVIMPIFCLMPWLMISMFSMAAMDPQSVARGNIINSIFAIGGIFIVILVILKIGDDTYSVSMIYYCGKCLTILSEEVITKKENLNAVPDKIKSLSTCPHCHERLDTIKAITFDSALASGLIRECGSCGRTQPKLGAGVGDRCSYCGVYFGGVGVKKI
jgi:ribosomal protein L37E